MRKVYNEDIRRLLEERHIRHYEIARAIGVTRFTFSVWISGPLPEGKRERILAAIRNFKD